ncbi:MAG: AzlD domain-containing protein [Actinomycetota bacterium]|nr:AzlD domain-containing protein [Actinomycetota bacterium]
MSPATWWLLVGLCAATTALTRGVGPAVTGARELPAPAVRVVVLLSSALLAALVVTSALADGAQLRIGADTAGVATAGVLLWRRAHVLLVVLAAAVVTGGLRALGVD